MKDTVKMDGFITISTIGLYRDLYPHPVIILKIQLDIAPFLTGHDVSLHLLHGVSLLS